MWPCLWDAKPTRSGALTRRVQGLPDGAMRTLTWVQGQKMARHQRLTHDTITHEPGNCPRTTRYHTPTQALNQFIATTHILALPAGPESTKHHKVH